MKVSGELGFVTKRTCISILQTNGIGINNSIKRLKGNSSLEGQEGIELDKHFTIAEDESLIWSQSVHKRIACVCVHAQEFSMLHIKIQSIPN